MNKVIYQGVMTTFSSDVVQRTSFIKKFSLFQLEKEIFFWKFWTIFLFYMKKVCYREENVQFMFSKKSTKTSEILNADFLFTYLSIHLLKNDTTPIICFDHK